KLIHGGLRYLREGDIGLVFEAVNERQLLLSVAPHLVQPLPFLIPVYQGDFPGLFALDLGLWAYEGMCLFRTPGRHRIRRAADTIALEPSIGRDRLKGSLTYFDGATDDSRLTLENALDAEAHGAVIATYAEVTGFHFADGDQGRIAGVVVADALGSDGPRPAARVRAKVTINAAGPWMDRLLAMSTPDAQAMARVVPAKGVHLVVDSRRLPATHAVVMAAPTDKRVVFTLPTPRLARAGVGRTVIGTTDTLYEGDRDRLGPDADDVAYLLGCANHYFPDAKLTPDDVLATWTGLRPLMAPKQSETNMSAISREHTLFAQPGLISVAGGKLTTFRRIAAQLVDAALKQLDGITVRPCDTATALFPGAEGITADEHGVHGPSLASLGPVFASVDAATHAHLLGTYGSRLQSLAPYLATAGGSARIDPELPFLTAEIDLAVTEEWAQRLDDVLSRRVPLALWARDQGLGVAAAVADRMGDRLGWSERRRQEEVSHFRQVVALSRQFRSVGAGV
ncbi:MAG: glycerol-3-phosphate dehydrogenase/oxidase, partial [Candidatus Sericytochromatia bacterium]|nr:glycerol-3-phosphate dehydrogenase/oxidase [Candidatus Sericytochromatia bacterium]